MPDGEHSAVVIEDDTDIRDLIAQTLRMKGFTVRSAATGQSGLAAVRDHAPDLVTLDVGLPDLDGVEVCRRIRGFSDAYIVMISARSEEVDRLMALETGADDYLVKPFSPRELQARVAAMFRRPRGNHAGAPAEPTRQPAVTGVPPAAVDGSPDSPGTLVHGPLVVDLEGRAVSVDGADVALTRTEFDLLATLLSAPRRVWTREVLLRTVWGTDWATDDHLVEVHVGNLRRKIGGPGGGSRFIRTVRGVGYRMELPEPG